MQITVEITDELAAALREGDRDISRAALEAIAVTEYRSGRLSDAQLRHLLGLTRLQADALLQAHGVWLDYSLDDFRREGNSTRQVRERLGR